MSPGEVARLLPPASESTTKRPMREVGVHAHVGRFEARRRRTRRRLKKSSQCVGSLRLHKNLH